MGESGDWPVGAGRGPKVRTGRGIDPGGLIGGGIVYARLGRYYRAGGPSTPSRSRSRRSWPSERGAKRAILRGREPGRSCNGESRGCYSTPPRGPNYPQGDGTTLVQHRATHVVHRVCVGPPFPEVAWEAQCGWTFGLGSRATFLQREDLPARWTLFCSACFEQLKAARQAAAMDFFSAQTA